jgi:DedD protein
MDQGLKERLIGAAVLVALGVWLIPWVLDGEKEQLALDGSEAALQLPTPEEPLPIRSQTLSLDEPDPFVAEAEPEPERADTPAPNAPPGDAKPAPSSEVKPTPAEEPVVARADTQPSIAEQPDVTAPSKPASTPPPAAPAPVARTDAKGAWVVQLGSFSEEANAKRLAQRVNAYGYKPDVSRLRASGRTLYRVRVGPYATRPQADASASALSVHGFGGQVVAAD